jgi:RsiW-degrading membrane proteinase PrsW (M82 family)
MCAIAQEHRHLVQVLPESPALWQRDYITLQPWSDYFPSILQLRNAENTRFWDHIRALSELSRRLIRAFGIFLIFAIVVTLLPVQYDRWQLAVMFGALAEPIIILFFTYWYWNRLDLSTDAIVKYFSSGFFLCTSMVLVYELLASAMAGLAVVLYSFIGTVVLVAFGEVDLDNLDQVNVDGGDVVEVTAPGLANHPSSDEQWHDTLDVPTPFVLSITLLSSLLNAFLVAAVVEEVFKYLSFWMVEHPDLESDVSLVPVPLEPTIDAEQRPNEDVGLLASTKETESYNDDQNMETSSMAMATTKTHPVSLESRGAAITVAMIAVAVGFACAENLLYVFVYTENNIAAEATTLVLRALFPVHPLCAAIQSIWVVQRDVEKDKSVGVGRIIFAAWLLHGSFDFLLMAYSAVVEILKGQSQDALGAGKDSPETADSEATSADWIVLGCSLLIPLIGLEYYFYNSRLQSERLRDLDNGRVSSSQILSDEEFI